MGPAERVVALAEAEWAFVAAGRLDDAGELADGWAEAIAALPSPLPPQDAADVRRALELTRRAAAALEAARDEVAAELRRLAHAREGARGYAPADVPGLPAFDRAA